MSLYKNMNKDGSNIVVFEFILYHEFIKTLAPNP